MQVKIGFEIHQQLATKKLFCSCPGELTDAEPDARVVRRLRPTQSELGEIDRAALDEFIKKKYYEYEVNNSHVCLVELDEEPPHEPTEKAVDSAIEIALLLKAQVVDEIHFMRKLVIDGSNTSGFQRTAIIAFDGYIDTSHGKVRIPIICLEEEAARKIKQEGDMVVYRLDRLGIPLVEITTAPDIKTPGQAIEAAKKIGDILRSTGKVKRGIGTIRQDINISIEGGARVEIKGVQDLDSIPWIITNEIERQKLLLDVKEEIENRVKKDKIKLKIHNLTDIFRKSNSGIIKKALGNRGRILGMRLQGFSGLLIGRLGPELAGYARVKAGVSGIFHSDELPAYEIEAEEVKEVRRNLNLSEEDAFVIVAERYTKARKALEAVHERALLAFDGIPEETRMVLKNSSSKYMRPLPGAARMYPETDIPPVVISPDKLLWTESNLPELIEHKAKRLEVDYKLNSALAEQLARSEYSELFEKVVAGNKKFAGFAASVLLSTLKELRREGFSVAAIPEEKIEEVLIAAERGKLAREAVVEVLKFLCEKPESRIETVRESLGLKVFDEDDLRELIKDILKEKEDFIREHGKAAEKPLMGVVMKQVRGKADGKLINRILREELLKFPGE
ncbi:aspartyl/glutamyl-tRNA(Asn/Gln) amidotransferase subunit B [archaeon]|nr:aspartyl/glutamyl-tRNA(Asn/Gln) amidotransferase subunit B [archaeon]